ncbi:hypothetical protein Moror_17140 [Moniliophthora roreri MCA 2997]|uniref:Uncharacterized protein n=2 Tax=Moniliophthora roreri TaxID=221103 RepID=A0A0W0FQY3_MONRR|nr:hypothetical protein Moror_17140 [Moniliophthora roreri MCA 2997]
MSINHSSRVRIKGKNTFNHVHGHQFNAPIHGNVVVSPVQEAVKHTEYDEFQYVRRGDMITVKEIHSEGFFEWDWKRGKIFARHKARRTIYTVEIVDRQSKFTAMVYEGKDAHSVWEDDFQEFSQINDPGSFRLFGINQSVIPTLIFHHELIPLAHIFTGSFWMGVYAANLCHSLCCNWISLWMNTTSGVLCSGPGGPFFGMWVGANESIVAPCTVDMLKDDTSFRFFSKFGSSMDDSVLSCAQFTCEVTYLNDLFPIMTDHKTEDPDYPAWISVVHRYIRDLWRNLPRHFSMDDIGGLRFDTVYSPSLEAVARRPQGAGSLWNWVSHNRRGFVDETVLDGGLTRFKFDSTHRGEIYLRSDHDQWKVCEEWLSQSCRVFDALDVTAGEEKFFTIEPAWPNIKSTPRQYESLGAFFNLCDSKPLVEETQPSPIYLFLHPFPMTISEVVSWFGGHFYFWSFDETGRCEMSEEECERWELPVLTCTTYWPGDSIGMCSCPTSTYIALRDWQESRGFDPTTSDWAQELGYPEWEIIGVRKSGISLRKLLSFKKKRKWAAHRKPSQGQKSARSSLPP